jgi:hypothetical protein
MVENENKHSCPHESCLEITAPLDGHEPLEYQKVTCNDCGLTLNEGTIRREYGGTESGI